MTKLSTEDLQVLIQVNEKLNISSPLNCWIYYATIEV